MKPTAIIVILASAALAGTTADGIPDSAYLDYAKGFAPYTKRIEVVMVDGRLAVSTAVCIDDRWALTAAHVVEDTVTASVGGNPVRIVFSHPDFESGKFGWFDIALLYCQDDFSLAYYPPIATGDEDVGGIVSIAGYGVTGRLSSGYDRLDGRLRAGTARIDRFEKTLIVCPAKSASPLPLCISPGDSGGPWFYGAGREARLVGISSFTMKDKGPLRSRAGEEQGATRVAYFREWIERVRGMVP